MEESKTPSTKFVLPVIVGVISLLNIFSSFPNWLNLSNLLSSVGIISCILYFIKNQKFTILVYIWILGQLIIIEPFFDLSQLYSLKFGMTFDDSLSININVIAIAFFGLFKLLQVSQLTGKKITFKKFREDST